MKRYITVLAIFATFGAAHAGRDSKVSQINGMLDGASGLSFTDTGEVSFKTAEWGVTQADGATRFKQDRGEDGYEVEDKGASSGTRRVQFVRRKDGKHFSAFTSKFVDGKLRSVTRCGGEARDGGYKQCVTASYPVCEYMKKAFGEDHRKIFDQVAACQKFFDDRFLKGLNALKEEREEQAANRRELESLIGEGARNPNPVLAGPEVTSFPEDPQAFYGGGFSLKVMLETAGLCRDLTFAKVRFTMPDLPKKGH